MNAFRRITASAALLLLVSATSQAQSLVIPDGPFEYGYTLSQENGYSQDAQSFIATGSTLTAASVLMREQGGQFETDIRWRFQLWSDDGGRPGSVIAEFGSYDPGYTQSRFSAVTSTPIPLTVGARYYLGLAAEIKPVSHLTGVLVPGFLESNGDAYTDGTVWAIRIPGPEGENLIERNNFDLSLTISMVPEPKSWVLLAVGLAFTCMWRRQRRVR